MIELFMLRVSIVRALEEAGVPLWVCLFIILPVGGFVLYLLDWFSKLGNEEGVRKEVEAEVDGVSRVFFCAKHPDFKSAREGLSARWEEHVKGRRRESCHLRSRI